jgi:hypothetical protein
MGDGRKQAGVAAASVASSFEASCSLPTKHVDRRMETVTDGGSMSTSPRQPRVSLAQVGAGGGRQRRLQVSRPLNGRQTRSRSCQTDMRPLTFALACQLGRRRRLERIVWADSLN